MSISGLLVRRLKIKPTARAITKAAVPAYEMQPSDMARTRPADSRDGMAGRSQRVWNVLGF